MDKIEALDIETILIDKKFRLYSVGISSGNKVHYRSIKEFNNEVGLFYFILEKCKTKSIYYVHNLTFESFIFLKLLIQENITFTWLCIKKNVYSLDITFKKKKIRLRCSYKLTLLSLERAAKTLLKDNKLPFPYRILTENLNKIQKLKEEDFNNKTDYTNFIKTNNLIINTETTIKEYCINDVIITKKLVTEYWKTLQKIGIEFNAKHLTAGSISLKSFFLTAKKAKRGVNKRTENMLRPFYFGGRCEVFGNPYKGEKILHYDWSGMYGQCMCEKLPCGEYFISKFNLQTEIPGFYYIRFKQNMKLPVLPIKEDKLYFKNGIFEGLYWFEEIELFKEMGGEILKISYSIKTELYEKEGEIFVNNNNTLREKGGIYKQIGKNNVNTLYGRLGMRCETEIYEIIKPNTKYKKTEKILNSEMGVKDKKTKSPNNILIACAITSKARIKLYKGFREVENNGGRLLYCDTDSIIAAFTNENYKNVINRPLGEVYFDTSKDDTEIDDAVFCIPKTYGVKMKGGQTIVKMKGVMKNSIPFNKLKWFFYKDLTLETIESQHFVKKNWSIGLENVKKRIELNTLSKRNWKKGRKETETIKYT